MLDAEIDCWETSSMARSWACGDGESACGPTDRKITAESFETLLKDTTEKFPLVGSTRRMSDPYDPGTTTKRSPTFRPPVRLTTQATMPPAAGSRPDCNAINRRSTFSFGRVSARATRSAAAHPSGDPPGH